MSSRNCLIASTTVTVLLSRSVDAFQSFAAVPAARALPPSLTRTLPSSTRTCLGVSSTSSDDASAFDFGTVPEGEEDTNVVLFSDEWDVPPLEKPKTSEEEEDTPWKSNPRWNSLNSKVKERIKKEARARAIANKKKREPAAAKKRRMMMFYRKAQIKKKRDARVQRVVDPSDRTPLADLTPGQEMMGVVISLTNFGAYVDVGTEVDGLLHISQISREEFVEHPRQVFTPGDEVTVRVVRTSPELKKLQLTMLPVEDTMDKEEDDDDDDRILLEEVEVEDEMWGEIQRVTSYGAYVDLGAEVEGFLHFMDHPGFGVVHGSKPSEFMRVGDRVRVWVSSVDMDKGRIKLTANRPPTLPGPRREFLR